MRYKKISGAMIRYDDETFDDKRRWVSRILAQLMLDDAIVISIDESCFKESSVKGMKWCMGSNQLKKSDNRSKTFFLEPD
jgi:hypothetical protein